PSRSPRAPPIPVPARHARSGRRPRRRLRARRAVARSLIFPTRSRRSARQVSCGQSGRAGGRRRAGTFRPRPFETLSGSATRELLPQRGERLVVGEGAGAGSLGGERRTGVHRRGGLGLGGLDDQRLVRLPAGLGGSVVLLPLLASFVGSLDPCLGLHVEALGVLVLPVLVVL